MMIVVEKSVWGANIELTIIWVGTERIFSDDSKLGK